MSSYSFIGAIFIGICTFIAICSMVLAFEERDDNDQYIQIGDIYTQVIEAYNRRTNKSKKSTFNASNLKYNSNRFQMTPIMNGNIVTRKQFKIIREARRHSLREEETKPNLEVFKNSVLSNMKSGNSGTEMNEEYSANEESQRLRRRSNFVTKNYNPSQMHNITQTNRTKEWVKLIKDQ